MESTLNKYPVEQYCVVMVAPKFFSTKLEVTVDFGEESTLSGQRLEDEAEKIKKFTSVVDALNYLSKAGWQLVNGFSAVHQSKGNISHYVMRKKVR